LIPIVYIKPVMQQTFSNKAFN